MGAAILNLLCKRNKKKHKCMKIPTVGNKKVILIQSVKN